MSNLNDLQDMMIALLANQSSVTSEYISQHLDMLISTGAFSVTDKDRDGLLKYLESQFDINMDLGAVVKEEFQPWLESAKAEIDPYFWDRYKRLLQEKGFGLRVIPKLDQVTDKILGLLENPAKKGAWERRGLVVGHVQSGKTANYTGLICKAADADYRLIIVIAGIHNKLRSQTQARIDEGFVGRDSSRLLYNDPHVDKYIGVGKFDHKKIPITLTNTTGDFSKKTAEMLGLGLKTVNVPIVMVIKKNYRTLENLIGWLKEHNALAASKIENYSMLLIDDEADNASINTNANPNEATRINGLIRQVLALFHKRCYLGYTATPFANIFIDPDTYEQMLGSDLFPNDFIVSLDPPSSYIGSEEIFGENNGFNIVREIDDFEDLIPLRHKITHEIKALPPSLYKAIRTFVLVKAIRKLRGQENKHNSMLINISRFTSVQSQIRNIVHDYIETLKQQVRFNYKISSKEALKNKNMHELYETWDKEFKELEFTWDEIQDCLLDAVAPVKVIEINSGSSDSLDYSKYSLDGLNIIAVGGFSLSRGLTLEGLSVSYFLRNSIMYDTLMQMGRWFGYRPGYEDLCRIYMTYQARSWYSHVSDVTEELRAEFKKMDLAGLAPKDFGLKVRSHPDSLIVTARNKMRTAETVYRQISLANRLIETDKLFKDPNIIEYNRAILNGFYNNFKDKGKYSYTENKNHLWKDVPVSFVYDFLSLYKNHPASIRTSTEPVLDYINKKRDDELGLWDVVIVNKDGASNDLTENFNGISIGYQDRYAGSKTDQISNCISVGEKLKVGSRGIEKEGLSKNDVEEAEDNFRKKDPLKKNIPDYYYREKRKNPLLMIHLLHLFYKKENGLNETICKGAVAYGISFPPGKPGAKEELVKYAVNTIWWRDNYGLDMEGDEEDE